ASSGTCVNSTRSPATRVTDRDTTVRALVALSPSSRPEYTHRSPTASTGLATGSTIACASGRAPAPPSPGQPPLPGRPAQPASPVTSAAAATRRASVATGTAVL